MDKITIPQFKLIGLRLEHKTTNEGGQSGIDCGNHWTKFEKENFVQKIPNKLSDEIYAVYFDYDGDYTKPFSYFIGCKVNFDSAAPEGMDNLVIPAGTFIKVIAKGKMPDCIANSWQSIWKEKTDRAYTYDFEIYDDRSKNWDDAQVDIFVSSN
jgi:predicted transcriptional regulator YdeE